MCNLYSITTNQAAIAALFRVVNRYVSASALAQHLDCSRSYKTSTNSAVA